MRMHRHVGLGCKRPSFSFWSRQRAHHPDWTLKPPSRFRVRYRNHSDLQLASRFTLLNLVARSPPPRLRHSQLLRFHPLNPTLRPRSKPTPKYLSNLAASRPNALYSDIFPLTRFHQEFHKAEAETSGNEGSETTSTPSPHPNPGLVTETQQTFLEGACQHWS
jgi:hypothetical protein